MSTDRAVAEAILHDVQEVADARIRAMMGGWLLYVDEVLVGQINQNELFIKETAFSRSRAPELERRPPYPGAQPALMIGTEHRKDSGWLHELLVGTVAALRSAPRRSRS